MDEYAIASSTMSRVKYSEEQRDLLETIFKETQTIKKEKAEEIALLLNVTPKQIQTWFQNKRAKIRRDRMRITRQSYILKRPSLPILDAICNKNLSLDKLVCQTSASSAFDLPMNHHPENCLAPSNFHTDASVKKGIGEQNNVAHNVPDIIIEPYNEGTQDSSNLRSQDYYNQHLQNLNQWPFQAEVHRETLSIPTLSSDCSLSHSSCSSPMSTISQSTWNSPGKSSSASDVGFLEELMNFDIRQQSPGNSETEYTNTVPSNTFTGTVTTFSEENRDVLSTIKSSYTDTRRFPLRNATQHQTVNITNDLNWPLADVNQNMSLNTRCAATDNNVGNSGYFSMKSGINVSLKENYETWCTAQCNFAETSSMVPENNNYYMNFNNQVQNNCYLESGNFRGYVGSC